MSDCDHRWHRWPDFDENRAEFTCNACGVHCMVTYPTYFATLFGTAGADEVVTMNHGGTVTDS